MDALHLTLYVAGDTPRSRLAMANLQRICAEHLGGRAGIGAVLILAGVLMSELKGGPEQLEHQLETSAASKSNS